MALVLLTGIVLAIVLSLYYGGHRRSGANTQPSTPVTPYRFTRRQYIMTETERYFYRRLFTVFGKFYLIFPQVHISTLLDHRAYRQNWRAALATIQRKSVDYVLCTSDLRIVAAIELDDRTHNAPDRHKRDDFVNAICSQAGLPLIRFRNPTDIDDLEIKESIMRAIGR